jgi:lysophospholipase L1-like esterase
MSQHYLLAAGVLIAGPMSGDPSVSSPPKPISSDYLSILSAMDNQNTIQSQGNENMVSNVDILHPEFSDLSPSGIINKKPQLMANSTIAYNYEYHPIAPTSGAQLYQQRVAALKAGKLYTRMSTDSFHSIWSKANQKPSYQQWKQLLAQEARVVGKGQGNNHLNVLMGDSLSLWFPSQLLPNNKFWLNQGISGENSSQILSRVSNIKSTRPDTIYILAGTNDLRQGVKDATILNNIRLIVRRLRVNHPHSEIVVQSILPTRNPNIPNSRIRNLNQQIMQIAQQEGGNYLNLYDLFVDSQDQLRNELTTDGLHLNYEGYVVWQSAIDYAESWIALHRNDVDNG